jgi:hypothetical protein
MPPAPGRKRPTALGGAPRAIWVELGLYAAAALGWIWLFWAGRAKIRFAKTRLAVLCKVD